MAVALVSRAPGRGAARRRTIRRAAEVPAGMVDEVLSGMARSLDGTAEARRCAGLSFAFTITDRRVAPARYQVGAGGTVRLTRGSTAGATFVFAGASDTFDAVLSGRASAAAALLRRRIRLSGPLTRLLDLLQMMPVLERAYVGNRDRACERHAGRYRFELA